MIKYIIIIALLLSADSIKADPNWGGLQWTTLPSIGHSFRNTNLIDFNIGVGKSYNFDPIHAGHLIGRLGIESSLGDNSYGSITGAKLGMELNLLILSLRLSGVNYFQNDNSEFWIVPEFGLCLGSYANFMIGHGLNTSLGTIQGLSPFRFTMSINLPLSF